jgi:hypothetical protein
VRTSRVDRDPAELDLGGVSVIPTSLGQQIPPPTATAKPALPLVIARRNAVILPLPPSRAPAALPAAAVLISPTLIRLGLRPLLVLLADLPIPGQATWATQLDQLRSRNITGTAETQRHGASSTISDDLQDCDRHH